MTLPLTLPLPLTLTLTLPLTLTRTLSLALTGAKASAPTKQRLAPTAGAHAPRVGGPGASRGAGASYP